VSAVRSEADFGSSSVERERTGEGLKAEGGTRKSLDIVNEGKKSLKYRGRSSVDGLGLARCWEKAAIPGNARVAARHSLPNPIQPSSFLLPRLLLFLFLKRIASRRPRRRSETIVVNSIQRRGRGDNSANAVSQPRARINCSRSSCAISELLSGASEARRRPPPLDPRLHRSSAARSARHRA
jgi:hypothetical protein